MRETLFFVPHFLFTGPLLWTWLIGGGAVLAFLLMRPAGRKEGFDFIPFYLAVAAIIYFVLPVLEVKGIDPDNPGGDHIPLGIAVRGYGMFLLLGMVSGVGVVALRARKFGVSVDQVLSLTFMMVIFGIIGARLFFVIQKHDSYSGLSTLELIRSTLDMTKGGLVVYGSLIGGVIGAAIYLWKTKLPALLMADLLAPGMMLGLALGRLGCLMNGCCFGGVCDVDLPSLQFPVGAPPYMSQLESGELLGMKFERTEDPRYAYRAQSVAAESLAEELGVEEGDLLNIQPPDRLSIRGAKLEQLPVDAEFVLEIKKPAQATPMIRVVSSSQLPMKSLPVHPTQVYSAINALLMFLFLWFYFPFRRSDGEVFAVLLIGYSVARFLLESIRTDELGQFGTEITISQWISFFVLAAGVAMLIGLRVGKKPATQPLAPVEGKLEAN